MSIRSFLAACVFTAGAAPVAAQDLYMGAGLDYGTPHSGEEQAFGSLIAGVTFDLWEYIGIGVEGELGQPINFLTDDGDERETARVKALLTYDFGPVTGIASLGAVQYEIGDATFDGETFGLGAQMEVFDRVDGRIEFLRDFVGDDYGTNVTTARLALLYKF